MVEEDKGRVSEWNEGNFKSKRLHDAQEVINQAKSNPLSWIYVKVWNMENWGYKLWFHASDVVFGEGQQKYSNKEKAELDKLKGEVETLINKPFINPITHAYKRGPVGYSVDMKSWLILKLKLENFEYLSKKYNDQHGLSTRNVSGEGLF